MILRNVNREQLVWSKFLRQICNHVQDRWLKREKSISIFDGVKSNALHNARNVNNLTVIETSKTRERPWATHRCFERCNPFISVWATRSIIYLTKHLILLSCAEQWLPCHVFYFQLLIAKCAWNWQIARTTRDSYIHIGQTHTKRNAKWIDVANYRSDMPRFKTKQVTSSDN